MKNLLFILVLLTTLAACKEKKENVGINNVRDHALEGLHLSDQQIQLGNITTGLPQMRTLGDELLLNAQVSLNQNLTKTISARVMGRIDKLYFKNSGELVSKGQPLFQIYSEELSISIRELLLSIEKRAALKNQDIDIEKIIAGTKRKLELFGLTEEQITEIEKNKSPLNTVDILSPASGIIISVDIKEGSYVMAGTDIFHLSDLSTVWVEAQVYLDDLKKIPDGSAVSIIFPSLPGKIHTGKVSFVSPELNPSSRINMIRIELNNPDRELSPGMQAYVSVLINKAEALSLPTDAIILDVNGATVWVKSGHNQFKSIMIETGIESNGYTEVKEGLSVSDTVVITGAYLLNSEYMFNKGANPMEGHDM